MKLSEQQIDKAVEWWMEAFRHPTFDTLGKTRWEHRDDATEMSEIMASMIALENPQDEANIVKFGQELKKILEGIVETDYFHGLFVDYGPERELMAAALAAGIDCYRTTFPWKTKMWFADGGVQVSKGYGAPSREILKEQTA